MLEMKKLQKDKNGITLIALVITIVVLLILAGVSIATLTGDNGILTRANEAKEKTEEAKEEELRQLTELEATTHLENETIIDNSTGKELEVTIPAGFAISQVEGEQTIEEGLVVIDSEGNEFVWVPVEDIDDMAKATSGTDANGNQNYQGKLYTFTSNGATEMTDDYGQETENYREPDILSYDTNLNIIKGILTNQTDKYADINTFKKTMQEDYNKMIKSISNYHGFYVSRYEMSKSSSHTVASVGDVTPLVNDSSNKWYGLYAYGKKYTNTANSVESSMIWGSQYDAMMRWMQSGDNGINVTSTIGDTKNTSTTTKASSTDVMKNVYDLYGCHLEWTLEANVTYNRVHRGGYNDYSYPPSNRHYGFSPDNPNGELSTRLTLYIK